MMVNYHDVKYFIACLMLAIEHKCIHSQVLSNIQSQVLVKLLASANGFLKLSSAISGLYNFNNYSGYTAVRHKVIV